MDNYTQDRISQVSVIYLKYIKSNVSLLLSVCGCVSVVVYLRWMSGHHPFLSRLHLVVSDGSLTEGAQRVEHSLLHLAKPILCIALCLKTFSQSHLKRQTEEQHQFSSVVKG